MPPKKRSSLSRNSRNAKRMRDARSQESSEERAHRLNSMRVNNATARAHESSSEREMRLTSDRERRARSRASETSSQQELRLTVDCERHVLSRESETFTERHLRLTADRERHILSRESETATQRELRLRSDRERHVLSRESETYTEHELRLTADRERHVLSRESETYTEHELRLTADRERHVLSRQSESSTQYHDRLTVDGIHHAITRSIEDEHDHDRRLESGREYYNCLRQEQTTSLSNERQRIDNIRSQETDEQREARLSADRFRHIFDNLDAHTEDLDEPTNLLPWANKYKSGFTYAVNIDYNSYSKIGDMNVVCPYCNALKWRKESAGFCCSGGKINLPTFEDPPEPLKSLLLREHTHSKHFLDNIRKFNSAFQMTSFGAQQISEGPFMPTFKIQGQVYHLIGSLLPADHPKFLQIYFVSDYNEQSIIRNQNFPNLNTELISELQHMLHQVNSYVCSFKSALEVLPREQDNNYKIVINADRRPTQEHTGRYNAPSTNEVAVVLVDQECDRRDIVIRSRDNGLQRIFETHRAYDSLQYPMIFCRGEDGYNFALYQTDSRTGAPNYNKKISCLQFYCYHLQVRQGKFLYLHRFRSLFNQFIVDMYAKIETERLVYIRSNQKQLRAEEYVHLRDAMQQDNSTVNMGRLVILPSSFTGGPRYMHERTQDAFCYVRKYGRPDLFITITTNPKWDKITHELLEGQASYDRHDIIARVFHLKLKLMINLLTKDEIFGEVLCFMYSVEWQKRGLPHAHILLWLKDKIRPNDVDSLISAEFPDPIADPGLYDIIKTHMVHGPCGTLNANAPCMQNGRCTKRYPKALVDQTITGHDGYPLYRRRSKDYGGFTVEKRVFGQQITLDNRWVVPYSPILSRTFQAHINVEMCNSVESIKYICKYINKGSDQATFALRNEHDEITRFQSGRYISSSEAVWRILSFNIHERYPPVTHLDVHLEGGQRIYFNAENVTERLENPRQTTLLAYFRLCQTDVFAKTLLYEEVPSYYTYDKQRGSFNRRRRGRPVDGEPGIFKEHVLGRVYTVHPNNAECFYLRLLLHTVRGSTSFIDLRTVDGIVYPTYHAACQAYHLLENDQHWDHALAESCISDNPRRLRHLFVTLMAFCNLSDAAQLWEKYKEKFAEDFLQNISHNNEGATNDSSREFAINQCLLAIQEELIAVTGKSLSEYGMPTPNSIGERTNREYFAEISYNSVDLLEVLENGVSIMTPEQRSIYDRVCESVQNNMGTIWFLDAPGGTGKTFLTKLILAYVRHQRKIALAVASSGIAATLLPGGKTAHTMFKIPIDLNCTESPTCSISRNSDKAKVLLECNLIIWDECTMAHRKGVEAVDRTLRDIRQNDRPMGGVTVLFCGDFRQILPVIPRGTRADEIRACLKSSNLWRNIQSVHLSTNMRVRTGDNPDDNQFSDTLLKIGEGTYPQQHGGKVILSPALCCRVQSQQDLITSVYGDLSELFERDNNWLCERSILTPRNDQASDINSNILSNIQGETKIYFSINRMLDQQEATNYPIEFLNSLNMPGLPSHEIHLKIGIPIILLRNLRPPQLCNGTRLKVIQLQQNIIEAQILTGCGAGEIVYIPRIPIIPNNFPFQFKRTQFPVSVCYAMTINKAQGQTFRVAGVDLSLSCFSHGQLYVALSRVSCSRNLYAYVPEGSTLNIVYPEALR